MLLSKLRVENFKGFVGAHEARLSRLTLIFGPNSAGKSGLLHALLLLSQSLPTRSAGLYESSEPQVVFDGPKVDLVGFINAVSRHDVSSQMALGVTEIHEHGSHGRGVAHTTTESFDLWIRWVSSISRPEIAKFRYRVDGSPANDLVLVAADSGSDQQAEDPAFRNEGPPENVGDDANPQPMRWRVDSEESGIDVLREILTSAVLASFNDATILGDAPSGERFPVEDYFDGRLDELVTQTILGRRYAAFGFLPALEPPDQVVPRLVTSFGPHLLVDSEWAQLLAGRGQRHTRTLTSIRHLGPLREAPQRAHVRLKRPGLGAESYVGPTGGDLVDVLMAHADALGHVNSWLEKLGMHYRLKVQIMELDDAPSAGSWATLLLTDTRTGVSLALSDVGSGVSQVLPVVAQLAFGGGDWIEVVEQPELHLHPKAQADLGDLLTEVVAVGGQVVVETHSEHLLLRVLKRVRQGELLANDVCVLYVDSPEHGGSSVTELRLNAEGEFIDEWPDGFFEERLDELID